MHAREIREHVPEPRRPHRERRRQHDRLVALPREPREPPRDVHVGGREHARLVERRQRARGAARDPRVEAVELADLVHAAPRSSTSLSSSTSAAGGCQENTPQRCPSTTGVSGPVMPRTNR